MKTLRRMAAGISAAALLAVAAPAQPAPDSRESLLEIVRAEKVDPYRICEAATKLAKVHPSSHAEFLGLFRGARLLRVKRWILKAMADAKMPGADHAVAEALGDPERLLRGDGAAALPAIAASPAFPDLVMKALKDGDAEVSSLAAKVLAGSPALVAKFPAEAARLASDPDPLRRQTFLANLSGSEATLPVLLPLLLKGLEDPDPATCMSAAQGLSRLAGVPGAPSLNAGHGTALASLRERLGHAEPRVAGAASAALLILWNPEVEAAVRGDLGSPVLLRRARAADLLRKKKLAFDPTALADVLARGTEDEQLYACGTLARVQAEACVPIAAAALASRHAPVRQAAVYALEVMEFPSAAQALASALGHADANVRTRAAIVLGRRPGATSAATALQRAAAQDADPAVREAARVAAVFASGADPAGALADRQALLAAAAQQPPRRFDPAAGRPTLVTNGVARVGSQKQLLVDDLVLESLGGARRALHAFTRDPRNPVLEQQFPWEPQGTLSYCTTVRYEPETRLFTFWYTSYGFAKKADEAIASRTHCVAYSTNGIHWVRPNLGLYEFKGARSNNLVGRAPNIVAIPDAPDPARRYASYVYVPKLNGMGVAFSPDGLGSWTDPQFVAGGGEDVVTVCRDLLSNGYFSFMKWRVGRWHRRSAWPAWGAGPEKVARGLVNVVAGFADDRGALARVAESFPGLDFYRPDTTRAEVYEVTPFIYEGIYFGLPVRFDISGPGAGNVDGPTDLCLFFCRDRTGKGGWARPGTEGYLAATGGDAENDRVEPLVSPLVNVLPHGRWGEWDATQHYGPSSLLVLDDEIVLYYSGASFGHEPEGSRSDGAGKNVYRSAIGRATLRLDGMVSLQADKDECAVATRPLVFEGRELVVNAACPNGRLQVELAGPDGRPLPGYERAACDAFRGDALRHVVTWKGRGDVAALAGQTLRVRFFLAQGDLYAFQFRP